MLCYIRLEASKQVNLAELSNRVQSELFSGRSVTWQTVIPPSQDVNSHQVSPAELKRSKHLYGTMFSPTCLFIVTFIDSQILSDPL